MEIDVRGVDKKYAIIKISHDYTTMTTELLDKSEIKQIMDSLGCAINDLSHILKESNSGE